MPMRRGQGRWSKMLRRGTALFLTTVTVWVLSLTADMGAAAQTFQTLAESPAFVSAALRAELGNLPLEEAPERPDPRQPELLAEQREQQEALQRALDQLSPEHRQVLLLRVVQQMSYDEIAQALSLESGTVKSRISRARRQLREILLRQGNFFSDSAVLPNRKEG